MESVIDIVSRNAKINIENEYKKLIYFFKNKPAYESLCLNIRKSLYDLFDQYFGAWRYRDSFTKLDEYLNFFQDLMITKSIEPMIQLIYFIEIVENSILFINTIKDKKGWHPIEEACIFTQGNILLKKLGYGMENCGDRVRIFDIKGDSLPTVQCLDGKEEEIAKLIMNYVDIDYVYDIETKKSILAKLYKYLEPRRPKLEQLNKNLCSTIFLICNTCNIRHNNQEGKNENESIKDMSDKDLLELYDKTYNLMLTAIRLLEFNEDKLYYDNLKTKK